MCLREWAPRIARHSAAGCGRAILGGARWLLASGCRSPLHSCTCRHHSHWLSHPCHIARGRRRSHRRSFAHSLLLSQSPRRVASPLPCRSSSCRSPRRRRIVPSRRELRCHTVRGDGRQCPTTDRCQRLQSARPGGSSATPRAPASCSFPPERFGWRSAQCFGPPPASRAGQRRIGRLVASQRRCRARGRGTLDRCQLDS
mmetsp:Transcript_14605/g.45856  ORF Transcript_14605/g.45856 Transcript_14605/m.45856 type:complete len:200 (+) Transcript_14605:901-1500(+)